MNKQKVTYALTVAAFLGSAALFPALADGTNITAAGNGAFSSNQVQANSNSSTNVTQSNTTQANNTVTATSNTGNNSANFNTGGTVAIQTGSANTTAGVSNTSGNNTAAVAGGSQGGQNTTVAGNGAFSGSAVNTSNNNSTSLQQMSTTNFANNVNVNNTTGNNTASFNTGTNVTIGTGNANAMVGISNNGGSNNAQVVGGGSQGGSSSTFVGGNGAFSDNNVNTNANSSTSLSQANMANFTNMVTENNNTGGNKANFNTGGSTNISTGNANAYVGITNSAGSNNASVMGGTGGQNSFIGLVGNGAFSASNVNAWNSLRTVLKQQNLLYAANYVSTMNNTGNNAASFNTGGDTMLTTGDANSGVTVFNTAGSNNAYVVGAPVFANAAEIAILGNGAFSSNNVTLSQNSRTSAYQKNKALYMNTIKTRNYTGNNASSFGTSSLPFLSYGYGSYGMNGSQTGSANSYAGLYNLASANYLSY